MPHRPLLAVGSLWILSMVLGVHLWAQWNDAGAVAGGTQVLLMPLLALALWLDVSGPRPRLVRLTLVALGFSWLGDTVPRVLADDTAFLAMVGCFLVAQVVYSVAFWPYVERSVWRVGRIALAPYVAGTVVLVALCAGGAGAMLVPLLVYAAALVTMAVLATGVNPLVWAGGTVFVISDALIALEAFSDISVPHSGFWVMLTYACAQVMIVLGVEEHTARRSTVSA